MMGRLSLLLLLILTCKSLGVDNVCNSSRFSETIIGKWVDKKIPNSFFSHSTVEIDWYTSACPVETIHASCFYRNMIDIGLSAENRVYEAENCEIPKIDPSLFLLQLRNRKVSFCCDAVVKQFFIYLACSLHNFTQALYDIDWVTDSVLCPQVFPDIYCVTGLY